MEIRDFRPKYHFTPVYGWNNDPNGLIVHDGVWHMYYQHNPNDTIWGPMHWGHAASADLIHWEHKPIALAPDGDVTCYSGSMVYDANNTSGFGRDGIAPLVAVYTAHDMSVHTEVQHIAYSLDGGTTFTKYEGNPVVTAPIISGEVLRDFRDPKVFWNTKKDRWCMVVAAFDRCHFYASSDLKHWEKTGEFAHGYADVPNCWACTDLTCYDTPDGERWVLLASMECRPNDPESRTMYIVGEFDGDTFRAIDRPERPLWVDFGWDNYAGVSFNDADRPIMIGWGANPLYANMTPTGANGFRGGMTFAREMFLIKCEKGYRLGFKPINVPLTKAEKITSECFGVKVTGTNGAVTLGNEDGECVTVTVKDGELIADRSKAGINDFELHPDHPVPSAIHMEPGFMNEEYSVRRVERNAKGDIDMLMLFDVSYLEIYADGGLETGSMVVYPKKPYTSVTATGGLKTELYTIG